MATYSKAVRIKQKYMDGSRPVIWPFVRINSAGARIADDSANESPEDPFNIGDGTTHPVSDFIGVGKAWADLTACQVDYPHVTADTDELAWAAIVAGIAAVSRDPKGGTLHLPIGRYYINRTIDLSQYDIVLKGDSSPTYPAEAVSNTVIVYTPSTGDAIHCTGSAPLIEGINIELTATTGYGVFIDGAANGIFRDIKILGDPTHLGAPENLVSTGFYANTFSLKFQNCHGENLDCLINLKGNCNAVTIENCETIYCNTPVIIGSTARCSGVFIERNTFELSYVRNIDIVQGRQIVIERNYFEDTSGTTSIYVGSGADIDGEPPVKVCVIRGNFFSGNGGTQASITLNRVEVCDITGNYPFNYSSGHVFINNIATHVLRVTAQQNRTSTAAQVTTSDSGFLFIDSGTDSDSNPTFIKEEAIETSGLDIKNNLPGGYGRSVSFWSTQNFGSYVKKIAARVKACGYGPWSSDGTTSTGIELWSLLANVLRRITQFSNAGSTIHSQLGIGRSSGDSWPIGIEGELHVKNHLSGGATKVVVTAGDTQSTTELASYRANNDTTILATVEYDGSMTSAARFEGFKLVVTETTAPAAILGKSVLYMDSTSHTLKLSENNGAFVDVLWSSAILSGTESPEGVVSAAVGILYRQTDGSEDTVLWTKCLASIGVGPDAPKYGWRKRNAFNTSVTDGDTYQAYIGHSGLYFKQLAGDTSGQGSVIYSGGKIVLTGGSGATGVPIVRSSSKFGVLTDPSGDRDLAVAGNTFLDGYVLLDDMTASTALYVDSAKKVQSSTTTNTELAGLHGLTASRVIVTNGSGILSASTVSDTVLGYLDATSSVQTQLNGKAADHHHHAGDDITSGTNTLDVVTSITYDGGGHVTGVGTTSVKVLIP